MNTITGWYTYKDTTTLQHKDIGNYLKKLFETTKPSQILEIGTSFGGLTLLIRDLLDDSNLSESDLRSYDVMETNRFHLQEAIKNKSKIDFRIENIFNHMYDTLISEEVIEYMQQEGVTILLCDGGSKKNEFNIFAKYLKKGDIIIAHDYSLNSEY